MTHTHPLDRHEEQKAAFILAGIAIAEGAWCFVNLRASVSRFFVYTGFTFARAPASGWGLALAVAALFTWFAARLPSVRATLFAPTFLKLLGLTVAITAGFREEAVFRKLLMDALHGRAHGAFVQVVVSGLAFGLVHGVWGLIRGSFTAALGPTIATGALGVALGLVFIASDRVLAPCIVAHMLINALAEPGLVLAAVRGEMSPPRL